MSGLRDSPYFALCEMVLAQLSEDWTWEYNDAWEAAEDYIVKTRDDVLQAIRRDIAQLFREMPESERRYDFLHPNGAFSGAEECDAWLLAVYNRIEKALAGIHTEPLVDPDPDPRTDADRADAPEDS